MEIHDCHHEETQVYHKHPKQHHQPGNLHLTNGIHDRAALLRERVEEETAVDHAFGVRHAGRPVPEYTPRGANYDCGDEKSPGEKVEDYVDDRVGRHALLDEEVEDKNRRVIDEGKYDLRIYELVQGLLQGWKDA